MRALLSLLGVTLLFPASGASAQEAPVAPDAPLVALAGPLAPGSIAVLRRALPLLGDFGDFALVRADAAQQEWLQGRGWQPLPLGPWPDGRELAVVALDEVPGDAEPLFIAGGSVLVALPAGLPFAESCLHGACVPRVPQRAGAPFEAPPKSGLVTDPRIVPLLPQVSAGAMQATVAQLSSYFTRRADSAQVLQARDWILAQLAAIPGVSIQTEVFQTAYGPNILATKAGSVHPERLVILGAHYDSINLGGAAFAAPGADDNASGSAGLLEACRVLAQGKFENTVRCVWFCAEELGVVGSEFMAHALEANNAQVVAMINMDMIAHRDAGDAFDLDLVTNDTDPALTQFCRDVTAAYVPTLPTVTGAFALGSSDHAPFAAHGYPAAYFFEDLTQYSKAVHTAGDTLPASSNDFDLARQITQALVATAATIASPVDLVLTHAPLVDSTDAGGPYPLAVQATSLTPAGVASVEVRWSVDGGPEQGAALLRSEDPALWVGSLPGPAEKGEVRYWLLATDAAGSQQWLPEALVPGSETYGFSVGTITPVYVANFEGPGDAGWTHAQAATQDDWQRGTPQGEGGDPTLAPDGAAVWGNDIGGSGFNGTYKPNVDNWLESPAIDCTGKSQLHLRYRRWLGVEDALFDQATIRVNGTTVWTNPSEPGGGATTLDTAWTLHDVDISALADGKPAVKLRFGLESDGGHEFGGWNLDAVQLASVGPGVVPPLVASALHASASAGAVVTLTVRAGAAHAGRKYLIALSASGTSPGLAIEGVTLPLNIDWVTWFGIHFLNAPIFAGFGGLLDAAGNATATWVLPPGLPAGFAGTAVSFAACTIGPVDFASNAVTVTLQP